MSFFRTRESTPSYSSSNSSSGSNSDEYVPKSSSSNEEDTSLVNSNASLTIQEQSVQELTPLMALEQFYRIKQQFDSKQVSARSAILHNQSLSKREKRAMFLKLKPQCLFCKHPSTKGMIFSIKHVETADGEGCRRFLAKCGDIVNPCPFIIELQIADDYSIADLLISVRKQIEDSKKNIINYKNKLLFDLVTSDQALQVFDYEKEFISQITETYEMYLNAWNNKTNNADKQTERQETSVAVQEHIQQIKECVRRWNESGDDQNLRTAATIYAKTLQPLLDKLRSLKYAENSIYCDPSTDKCHLIQREYLNYNIVTQFVYDEIIEYHVGPTVIARNQNFKPLSAEKPVTNFVINIPPSQEEDSSLEANSDEKERQKLLRDLEEDEYR